MSRTRIIGLALVAVFAMSAVAASAASAALPEFIPTGKKFPVAFTSKSGVSILWTAGGKEIVCQSDTNKGNITGAKTDEVTVEFFKCEEPALKVSCGTSGTIKTNLLASTLGYLNAATHKVGLLLEPKTAGALFAEFKCSILTVKVSGSVICEITPVNTVSHTFVLHCRHEKVKPFKQEFNKFEGETATHELEALGEKAGFESEDTIALAGTETAEIKA
jgi:hypothetical protein